MVIFILVAVIAGAFANAAASSIEEIGPTHFGLVKDSDKPGGMTSRVGRSVLVDSFLSSVNNSRSAIWPLSSIVPLGCSGTDKTWDGGAGTSNWNDPANWNPDGVPFPGQSVVIDSGALPNQPILNINSPTLDCVVISSGVLTVNGQLNTLQILLNGTGSMTINASGGTTGSTAGATGDIQMESTGSLTSNGSLDASIMQSNGTINLNGSISAGSNLLLSGGNFAFGATGQFNSLSINGGSFSSTVANLQVTNLNISGGSFLQLELQ